MRNKRWEPTNTLRAFIMVLGLLELIIITLNMFVFKNKTLALFMCGFVHGVLVVSIAMAIISTHNSNVLKRKVNK